LVGLVAWFLSNKANQSQSISQSPNSKNLLAGRDINFYESGEKYIGLLQSEREVLVSPDRPVGSRLEIGDTRASFISETENESPLAFGGYLKDISLEVVRIKDQLLVSTIVRNDKGVVVAEIKDNEWKVSPPPNTWIGITQKIPWKCETITVMLFCRCAFGAIGFSSRASFMAEMGTGLRSSEKEPTGYREGAFRFLMQNISPS
jgi:hypothetical protein